MICTLMRILTICAHRMKCMGKIVVENKFEAKCKCGGFM